MKFKIAGFCIALLFIASSAFAQWQWAYQQELSYAFESVHFPSANIGYICGSNGVVFKTSDGAATWVEQTTPVTSTLNEIFFRDNLNGFAVGAGGTIIYTTDGGTNWLVHAQSGVITTATIHCVWFVGLNGWIGAGADNQKCQIYSTTDGGVTWANTVVTNPSTDMCTDISFASATLGYASLDGNAIMYTTDGGVNWTKSTVNFGPYPYTRNDVECIFAVDATRVVATGWGSSVGTQPTIILYSNDSGVTFNCPDDSYPWRTHTYGYGIGKFANGELILVGGGSAAAAPNIHSTDMGASWTRYPTFFGDNLNGVCVLPGTNKVVAVGDAGCIALSTDRGYTWTFAYDPGSAFQGVGDFADMGKNKLYAALTGSALLYFDVAAGTHKYGMASPEHWGPANIRDIDYVVNTTPPPPGVWDSTYNDVIYISGGNKYLVKSYNYGKTWHQLSHNVSNFEAINGMYWFHPDTGFAVGCVQSGSSTREETIWKTTDGGKTLNIVLSATLPGGSLLWGGIDFAPDNRNIGVVVGDDNYIMYTTNGGATWNQATENIATGTLDLESVVMIDSSIGFAVGDSGTLVKTTDGGASWTVQAVPWGTVNLLVIAADGPNRIWVGGIDQLMYYSTDLGATWTNVSVTDVAPTHDVRAIYYQGPAGILWVGCDIGQVLYRTDTVAGTETPKSLPFILNQNFPNPFNPSTTIEFSLAYDDHVTLNVYNAAGKLVATVMDKDLKAGDHRVGFRADGLASGVYFYRLSTSRGVETRKMVLLR